MKTYFGKFPLLGSCHLKTKKNSNFSQNYFESQKIPLIAWGGRTWENERASIFKAYFCKSPLMGSPHLKTKKSPTSLSIFLWDPQKIILGLGGERTSWNYWRSIVGWGLLMVLHMKKGIRCIFNLFTLVALFISTLVGLSYSSRFTLALF